MFKSLALFSLAAAVSLANAQSADPQAAQTDPQATAPSQPVPIVRAYPSNHSALRQPRRREDQIVESQPIPGVWLRSESSSALSTLSTTSQRVEFRLDRGRLNLTVHHPADHAEILVDLPGGQVSLFKDGLYTLNADTNTVRVLHGEAAAYPGPIAAINTNANPAANLKPIKIKEDHQLSLVSPIGTANSKSSEVKSVEAYPYELAADLLPSAHGEPGYAEYADGYPPYAYPYYAGAWGYPYYGYGYPFAYGIGFGYYGGFHGGYGYRGGFHR